MTGERERKNLCAKIIAFTLKRKVLENHHVRALCNVKMWMYYVKSNDLQTLNEKFALRSFQSSLIRLKIKYKFFREKVYDSSSILSVTFSVLFSKNFFQRKLFCLFFFFIVLVWEETVNLFEIDKQVFCQPYFWLKGFFAFSNIQGFFLQLYEELS